ncbi:response regulator [Myxococcota bacterium]|nr:response regulator [Myxococcota bacterium]MBU1382250.1 response regulator [Myxococcota bacterium]MBU1496647.1 response regulator [Myxococcota bacterium]
MNLDKLTLILQQNLLLDILHMSEDMGDAAGHVTTKIREIVGARTVALFEINTEGKFILSGIGPEKRRYIFSTVEGQSLVDLCLEMDNISLINPGEGGSGKLLEKLGLAHSIAVPLKDRNETLGLLLILDLMDTVGVKSVMDSFASLSSLLAIILRNSFLYRNMEDLVEKRTSDLRRSEERFRRLVEGLGNEHCIFSYSPDGTINYASPGIKSIFGISPEEIIGKNRRILPLTAESAELMNSSDNFILQNLQRQIIEIKAQLSNDDRRIVMVNHAPAMEEKEITAIEGIFTDITDYRRAQEEKEKLNFQVNQLQKLESLGILAGGIAHDFNNMLGGILGCIEIASLDTQDPEVSASLKMALSVMERARSLTGQLLTFARGGAPVKKPAPLFPFVRETSEFALTGSSCNASYDVPPNLCNADYDPSQIGQVIENIVINAAQSMASGGTIKISASNEIVSTGDDSTLTVGPYVKISFSDSGCGIPSDNLSRIFEPFFTTRKKGHGLGLATSFSIVKRHGGTITVSSSPGCTCFSIWLPATTQATEAQSRILPQVHRGSGIIVIVDDDEAVRRVLTRLLESFGYTIVAKENGVDGLEYVWNAREMGTEIKAMIFDLTIPGSMGGKEAIEIIRRAGIKTPVFVASGYADDPCIAHPENYGFTDSISKPFLKQALSNLLSTHLS